MCNTCTSLWDQKALYGMSAVRVFLFVSFFFFKLIVLERRCIMSSVKTKHIIQGDLGRENNESINVMAFLNIMALSHRRDLYCGNHFINLSQPPLVLPQSHLRCAVTLHLCATNREQVTQPPASRNQSPDFKQVASRHTKVVVRQINLN